MVEKLIELIKLVLEKYVIDTIISFVISGVIFLFTPENFWILEKLKTAWYIIFVAGCIFILLQTLKVVWIKIKSKVQCVEDLEYGEKENT